MQHEQRLIYALWHLRKLLPRMLDRELEPLGITMTGFGVLDIVERRGPMSGADLARWEDVRPQTMATLMSVLIRDGLLERHPHPVDVHASAIPEVGTCSSSATIPHTRFSSTVSPRAPSLVVGVP